MSKIIGFVGLGIMGSEIFGNIVEKGTYQSILYNRTSNKCAPFREKGAKVASSPAELAKSAEVIILMLSDNEAVKWVLEASNGILTEMGKGKTLIDMGTNTPQFNMKVNTMVRERGGSYLEAPVLGSKIPAREGKLTILCGGEEEIFEQHRELLSLIGEKLFFLGECGRASQMKLIINQIMAGMMALFSEGLVTGERAGLSPSMMLEVIEHSAINAPILKLKGYNMLITHDFTPHFPLKHAQKDLAQALACAERLNVSSPVTASANAQFILAKDMGFSEEDSSAIIKTLIRGDGEVYIDL